MSRVSERYTTTNGGLSMEGKGTVRVVGLRIVSLEKQNGRWSQNGNTDRK
jgi:hypothetical protein